MGFLIFLLLAVIVVLIYQIYRLNTSVVQKAKEKYEAWKEKDYQYIKREQREIAQQEVKSIISEQVAMISEEASVKAQEQYNLWCSQNIERITNEQKEMATREAQILLQQWIEENNKSIRQDAIQKSQSVITGKVIEHFVPFLPEFTFNPKDARFIGSPVDFIVFDGLDEDDLRDIWLIEVKTGSSSLKKRQKQIKTAIQEARVKWVELRRN